MQKENVKKYVILMAITGILLMITGVGYALFTYLGLGSKYISISSNGVTFSYLESKTGLSLTEAIPKPDEIGKTDSNYFEFYIRANSNDTIKIPYYITTRKTNSSSNIDDAIKLYLTRVSENGNEEEVALVKFADLKQYTNSGIDLSKYVEKLLYNTEVPIGKGRYRETYRLRMWIDYDTNFNEEKYRNATFKLTVNVYASGKSSNKIYADYNGRLHVAGSKLMNQYNEEFRITGVSSASTPYSSYATYAVFHDQMYSVKSLNSLKSWGVNGFRIFCSKSFWESTTDDEYNNTFEALKGVVDKLIDLDMYVMLNWSPGGSSDNNQPQTEAAKRFFNDISSYYQNDYHIMYEIWNEPLSGKTWEDITNHANQVIPVIRANAPDSIILVGTPNFDQRVDQVIGHELAYDNIMYTHHTYTNHVNGSLKYLNQAKAAGLPVFETECAAVNADSNKENWIYDAAAFTLFNYLDKENISYMFFCYEIGPWSYNFIDSNGRKWYEDLPESKLKENALFLKKMLQGIYTNPVYLLKSNTNTSDVGGTDYRSAEWKDKIVSIEFKNKLNIPNNVVHQFDLSVPNDNSIVGYLLPTEESEKYKMIIAANGDINLPRDCRFLFADLTNLKTIDFTNVKTDEINDLGSMFANDGSLESLDLSNFNTDKVTKLWNTFRDCTSLKNINLEGWHPVIEDFGSTFYNCTSLESLDLSGWNVSNVSTFALLFYNNKSLKKLNISTWNPAKVTNLNRFLMGGYALEEVNMSSFTNITDTANLDFTLKSVKNGARIIVHDQEVIDKLSPTATNQLNFVIAN